MPVPLMVIPIGEQGKMVGQLFSAELDRTAPQYRPLAEILDEPTEESCRATAERLCRTAEHIFPVCAWVIGDLTEENVPGRVSQEAEQLRTRFQESFPILKLLVDALMVIPPGQMSDGTALVTFLEAQTKKCPPFDFCWLISRGRHLLSQEELAFVAAKFLLLCFLCDLPIRIREHNRLEGLGTHLGTFGISGLVVPANELTRREAAHAATQVLLETCKNAADDSSPSLIEQFLQRQHLSPVELQGRMREGSEISFSEKERKISLAELKPASWPDKLWSIYYFFAFGGLSPYIGRISRNRGERWSGVERDLTDTVTELVEKRIRPSDTLSFLEQLETRVAAVKGDREPVAQGKVRFQNSIEELKKAYKELPSGFGAVLIRVVLTSMMLAYVLHLALPRFLVLPQIPLFLLFAGLFSATFLLLGAVGFLFYSKKRNYFQEARSQAQETLWGTLDSALDAHAHNAAIEILEDLQCASGSPETLKERNLPCNSAASQYSAVRDYVSKLKEVPPRLAALVQENRLATPVFEYLEHPTTYKDGAIDASDEAASFVRNGLHRGWRLKKVEELANCTLELATAGVSPVKRLEDILSKMKDKELITLGKELLEKASPLVAFKESPSQRSLELRYLFVRDAESSQVVSRFHWQELPGAISTEDPYSLFLLEAHLGLAPDAIVAFDGWKRRRGNAG